MSFLNELKINKKQNVIKTKKIINEVQEEKPEDLLRGAGFKIKLVTPTSFGTQIDLAKVYDEDELKELLSNFDIKIKGKSLFVVN